MSQLFLGLDCSTQSMTAVVIDYNQGEMVHKYSLNYDNELNHYNTTNGVYINDDNKTVHSNPLMWVEALEKVLNNLKKKVDLKLVKCISGSGQQHGTVYLNKGFTRILNDLNYHLPLVDQLSKSFSRETSPIWMDSSTKKQCEEIREKIGGSEEVIKLTGSDTFERFSGPQIRKFFQEEPKKYRETSKIHLISSFLASILVGGDAPIDYGDGAGMNLMNIRTKEWDNKALDATAPNLKKKLPSLIFSNEIIGRISPYFVQKYGFQGDTKIIAWSGDNPNSLIGVGITAENYLAISLGTSDTLFGYLDSLIWNKKGEGHIFVAPTGDYLCLICFKNGSLAREKIKNQFNLNWNEFSSILESTPPGNNGKVMLPYFFPEIIPLVLDPRVYRFGLDKYDKEGNVRAIIEAQFLSMKLHSKWMAKNYLKIHATGGASANSSILQVAADIFQTDIFMYEITDSAALGAALRALKSYYEHINRQLSWKDLFRSLLGKKQSKVIHPRKNLKNLYEDMLFLYQKCENFVLYNTEDPEEYRLRFKSTYFD